MLNEVKNGTIRIIDGQERIFYDNHWIKHYNVPNTLAFKKNLIDMLTRRVFRHAEPGINTPGSRLEEVRDAYNTEADPLQKRVLAAMLAGSLLNRGSEILTRVVELEEIGVTVKSNNELLRECGRCFMGALEYGKNIRPLHGNEELDELWGEPFKAFTMPVNQFLETRYIKMAHTMSDMDIISHAMKDLFIDLDMFPGIVKMLEELTISAKLVIETQKSDEDIINVWPRMIGAADQLNAFDPIIPEGATQRLRTMGKRGKQLIEEGTELIVDLANIRVPRPKSTEEYLERAHAYAKRYLARMRKIA